MTEKALQQSCYVWFHNNYPELRGTMWMNHNQASNRKQGAILKGMGMVAGVSDILWLYDGTLYCLELKTSTGRQSEAQKEWCDTIEQQGGVYIIIRSLEDFQTTVRAVLACSYQNGNLNL